MRAALLALALLMFAHDAYAQDTGGVASDLPAAVADERISVSSAYRGSIIDVWGVNPDRRGRGDIVVVVRGPNEPATVMRKRQAFGLWVNSGPVRFSEAPSFFAVLSNRSLRTIASPQAIWSLELDPAASAQLESEVPAGADPSEYRAALVRLRTQQRLYLESRTGLTMYPGGLFRARIQLPANAPIADYHADTYLFRNGRLISSQRIPISVSRVGVERRIHDLATQYSFLYGLLVVGVALSAGWVASVMFRRI